MAFAPVPSCTAHSPQQPPSALLAPLLHGSHPQRCELCRPASIPCQNLATICKYVRVFLGVNNLLKHKIFCDIQELLSVHRKNSACTSENVYKANQLTINQCPALFCLLQRGKVSESKREASLFLSPSLMNPETARGKKEIIQNFFFFLPPKMQFGSLQ